ncbi:MAG: ATP-binding protein [Sphingopyxis sp.]
MWRMIGPRSLGGQLMLVAALALMLAQAINLALLVNGQRQERLSTIASGAAVRIIDVAERIAAGEPIPPWMLPRAPGTGRRGAPAMLQERNRGGGPRQIIIDARPHFRPGMADWPDMAGRVRTLLGSESGVTEVRAGRMALPARTVDQQRPGDGARRSGAREAVAVTARLADGRWVTVRSRVSAGASRLGTLLIGQTLILFGLMLIPLLFVAWRVNRPLARLASAAGDTRLGQHAEPVPESGPQDVRDLTRAFNAMRARIGAMMQDKDRMLGAVGHDLRTPLTSLRIRAEQVKDAVLRDKMSATIEEMAAMLDDILALARAGQPHETPEPTDLAAMLAALALEYQEMEKAVALAGEAPVTMRPVRVAALRRAMRNLIDNALCYGGSATVGLAQMGDGSVALSVEDDGPGIAEESIAAMTEPFARAEASRNRNTGGAGLGLALVKAIAEAEGGALEIRNRTPKGLSARIILPPQMQASAA